MMVATLNGTGTCFDDISNIFEYLWHENQDEMKYKICHGICTLADSEGLFSHAWIELEDYCYDMKIDKNQETLIVKYDLWEFYEIKGVKRTWEYSAMDALEMSKKHKNTGPWEMEMLKLCGDYTEGMQLKGCREETIES